MVVEPETRGSIWGNQPQNFWRIQRWGDFLANQPDGDSLVEIVEIVEDWRITVIASANQEFKPLSPLGKPGE